MAELLHKEETYKILGAAFEVYNQLGNGFLEPVYQEALELEFKLCGVPAEAQKMLHICYKGHTLNHVYRPDFVAFGQIIVELKALHRIGAIENAQLINYLKITAMPVGLLLNFGAENKLEWKRIVV